MTLPIDSLITTAAPTTGTTLFTGDLNTVLTQLRDRAGEMPSVRDKGAVGNGTTGDQAAFGALTTGWWLVPPGTYRIASNLSLATGVKLWVQGGVLAPDSGFALTLGSGGRIVHDGTGIGGAGTVAAGSGVIINFSSGGLADALNDSFGYVRHALGWARTKDAVDTWAGGLTNETARPLSRQLGDNVSLTNFGSVSPGSSTAAQVSTAMTQALAAANTVVVPPGSWACNAFTIPAGQSVSLQEGAKLTLAAGQTVTVNGRLVHNGTGLAGSGTFSAAVGGAIVDLSASGGASGGITIDTTIRTSDWAAVANKQYRVDLTSAVATMTLPATPPDGTMIEVWDISGSWATHNLTVARNGATIGGAAANKVLTTASVLYRFIYTATGTDWDAVLMPATPASGGGISEAPIDANSYARGGGAWQQVTDTLVTAPTTTNNLGTVTGTVRGWLSSIDAYLTGNLAALHGLTGAANTLGYFTGLGTMATTSLTALGRSVLGASTLSALMAVIGTGVRDGTKFLRDDGTWQAVAGGSGGIAEAPTDGQTYGRQSSAWTALGLSSLAPLASPHLTGIPTAPTAASSDISTTLATTAFVHTAVVGATGGSGSIPGMTTLRGTWSATGDGSTDDSTAFANAVAWLNGAQGRILHVEPGTYRLTATQTITQSNSGIVGLGEPFETIFLDQRVSGGELLTIASTVDNVLIKNIRFQGNGTTGGSGNGHAIAIRGGNTSTAATTWVNGIRIINCFFDGFRGNGTNFAGTTITARCIYAYGVLDMVVDNCVFTNGNTGIEINGDANLSYPNKVVLNHLVFDTFQECGINVVLAEGIEITQQCIFNRCGNNVAGQGGIVGKTLLSGVIEKCRFKLCFPTGIDIRNPDIRTGSRFTVRECYWYMGAADTMPGGGSLPSVCGGVIVDTTHEFVEISGNTFDAIFDLTGGYGVKIEVRESYNASNYVVANNNVRLNSTGKFDYGIWLYAGGTAVRGTRIVNNRLGYVQSPAGAGGFVVAGIAIDGNAWGTLYDGNTVEILSPATAPTCLIQRTAGGGTPNFTMIGGEFHYNNGGTGTAIFTDGGSNTTRIRAVTPT